MHRRVLCVPRKEFQSKILSAATFDVVTDSGSKKGKNIAPLDEANSWSSLADNLLVWNMNSMDALSMEKFWDVTLVQACKRVRHSILKARV